MSGNGDQIRGKLSTKIVNAMLAIILVLGLSPLSKASASVVNDSAKQSAEQAQQVATESADDTDGSAVDAAAGTGSAAGGSANAGGNASASAAGSANGANVSASTPESVSANSVTGGGASGAVTQNGNAANSAATQNSNGVAVQSGETSGNIIIDEGTSSNVTLEIFTDTNHANKWNGEPITENDTLYAAMKVAFSSSDTPNPNQLVVKYKFPSNIGVKSSDGGVLRDDAGNRAGTWTVGSDGYAVLTYDESWVKNHPSGVVANLEFEFALNAGVVHDGDKVDINFPGASNVVSVPIKEGDVNGNKWGSYNASTGKITWTIQLNPTTDVSDLVVTDTVGNNLSFVEGSFKLDNEEVVGEVTGQTSKISCGSVSKGWHTLTYETTISEEALAKLGNKESLSDADNDAAWSWGASGQKKDPGAHSNAPSNIQYDMVSKSAGSGSNDDISWTVTINAGSLKADMAGYKFTDTLQEGHTYKGSATIKAADGKTVTVDLDPAKNSFEYVFPDDAGKQQYTITYHTQMTDTSSKDEVKNTAAVEKENSPSGSYENKYAPLDTDPYIEKTLTDDNGKADGVAKWESVIHFSQMAKSTDPSSVVFSDWISVPGNKQALFDEVNLVLTDGSTLTKDVDYTLNTGWNSITVTFTKSCAKRLIEGEENVTVSYATKVTDPANGTYANTSQIQTNKVTKQASASYDYENGTLPAVIKEAAGNPRWDQSYEWDDGTRGAWVVDWKVFVNGTSNWEAQTDLGGLPVTVADNLPSNMHYKKGSGKYSAVGGGATAGTLPSSLPKTRETCHLKFRQPKTVQVKSLWWSNTAL